MQIDGFLNVLKPPGMTSHDVVSCLRRVYGTKKVGHAGTLDPAAAGVLPIALGKATRLLEDMADVDKSYRTELIFGYQTATGDDTGEVLAESDYDFPATERIVKALQSFRGKIEQVPPIYSAIKINGKKACDLARQNQTVQLPPRQIEIHAIELVRLLAEGFVFDVTCSKGTYVRSLCVDLGKALQVPAVMGLLIRTRVGGFELTAAKTLEEIAEAPLAAVQGLELALSYMAEATVDAAGAAELRYGRRLPYAATDGKRRYLVHCASDFVGICRRSEDGQYLVPVKIFS